MLIRAMKIREPPCPAQIGGGQEAHRAVRATQGALPGLTSVLLFGVDQPQEFQRFSGTQLLALVPIKPDTLAGETDIQRHALAKLARKRKGLHGRATARTRESFQGWMGGVW